ncbi:MAG: cytochrome c biogenesis protein CcsA [Flavobacteriales bacterium]|nr:cytochrome c biogenesis protein CcsA [Flavobacteriales bacterium]MBL6873262.1 cytochrome c biogenesis protein CcsA [Flavobacteriales bacterium]
MFDKLLSALLSMRLMAFLILLFFVAIGYATFIENDFGTQTAKALVYNATWFEIIIVLLTINMLANINRYKLWRKEKWPVLLFHISFVIIVIGAGITRYVSFEGMMPIREGEQSDLIISDGTFLQIKVHDNAYQYNYNKPILLDDYQGLLEFLSSNEFSQTVKFLDNDISIDYLDYVPNAQDTLIVGEGVPTLTIVLAGANGRETYYLQEGRAERYLGLNFSFGTPLPGHVNFFYENDELMLQLPEDAQFMRMADQFKGSVKKDSIQPLMLRSLYMVSGQNFVVPILNEKATLSYYKGVNQEGEELEDLLKVKVSSNGEEQIVELFGDKGMVSNKNHFQLGGLNFSLSYGSMYYQTPFFVRLNDFQLERYPGSNSPASFASEVTLIDGEEETDHRIFMNNVLDYKGYRFFQASYDQDELGTVLSVNHDFWGTWISYLGYLMMSIGMIATIFSKKTRFSNLRKKLDELRTKRTSALMVLLFLSMNLTAQDSKSVDSLILSNPISIEHADKFGMLVVQDEGGRMKPFGTTTSEILRKVSRKSNYNGLNSNQVVLGMLQNPYLWQLAPMIKVNNDELREKLGLEEKYTSFLSFFSDEAKYVLTNDVQVAYAKKPAERSKYDKEVMAVDERVNISYMVYNGSFLRFFPIPDDPNNKWVSPAMSETLLFGDDSLFVNSILPIYYRSLQQAQKDGDYKVANNTLTAIGNYQKKFGADVYPSDLKLKTEVFYNNAKVFNRLSYYYALVGLVMILLLIQQILKERKWRNSIIRFALILVGIGFAAHTIGLMGRWFISNHAPWSNAYESVIYIAWATVLAGFIFARKSLMTVAATAILSSLLLMVAALNWLDPEITNLVPVLDSYWLLIHVAIITASYGFLALGALLGFLNLILMIIQNKTNKLRISNSLKELTYINEMSITTGLFMLSIGTFLGGVWANESWGRYWGWDPKETWALASMLIYIFVLHMRFVPKLKGMFAFNFASILAYGSIIMTYFGVNFYLSGLHSYAKGDPMPIPTFVYYSIAVIAIVSVLAQWRQKRFIK